MATRVISQFIAGTDDRKVVAAAGTPEALGTTAIIGVCIVAESDNTGNIAVGMSNAVRAAAGSQKGLAILAARESVFVPAQSLANVWIDASVSGDGVAFTAVTS